MFRIVCKSIHSYGRTLQPQILFIQQFSSSAIINSNKSISTYTNQDSFAVGYLINEFGFSLEKAVLASKYMRFQNRNQPDLVVSFLKNQGFSQTQIRKLISIRCAILNFDPENTILPKIEFFRSEGISSTDLAKMIAFDPNILARSLKDHISPSFKFLRDFLGSNESVICMIKSNPRLLNSIDCHVKPNIEVLSQAGVPYSNIAYLLKNQWYTLASAPGKLKKAIEEVQKMGMDNQIGSFCLAILVLTVTSRSKWNERMEAYKRWGCSEEEVLTSFRLHPWIMAVSEEKINGVMSFCVNEMGWDPSEVVRKYILFTLSLNKRIRPRWSVYKELVLKSLVKEGSKVKSMFTVKEDVFLQRYVHRYKDEAPLLLKLYLEKLEASK